MSDGVTVRIKQGELKGKLENGVSAFLGVPYAAPPFGELRMQPPAPAAAWDGVRDATQYGPTAPKDDYGPQYQELLPEVVIAGDECLNLNIWTPDPQATGLPVYVWIHGGAFLNGSGSVAEYNGAKFARDGVVCVTINYRLGAEGFLFTQGDTNNVGVLDQLAALQWVHDNIAAFGGDPAKVTIGGESAGAMSVTTLLSMPQTAGLMRGAIAQSGAGGHSLTPQIAAKVTALLASRLGVEPTRAAIAALSPETVYKVAGEMAVEVQGAPDPTVWGELALSLLPFAPVVDGDVLAAAPLDSLRGGQNSDVKVLIGTNLEESRLFMVAPGVIGFIDEPTALLGVAAYGAPAAETFQLYSESRPGVRAGDVLAAIVTDWFFRVPAIRVAEARGANTWMYRFDWQSPAFNGELGSAHAVEIPFTFDNLDSGGVDALLGANPPQALADTVHAAWVRFIKDADPGWSAYDADTRTTRIFGGSTEIIDDPDSAERKVWDGIR